MKDFGITEGCKLFFPVNILSVTSMCSSELTKCLLINVGRQDRKLKFPAWGKGIKAYFLFFLITFKIFMRPLCLLVLAAVQERST